MRRWLAAVSIILSLAAAGAAEPSPSPIHLSRLAERDELVGVVDAQLAAFRTEDWEKAYSYAAASFQAIVSPQAFVTLITRNYQIVQRNTRAEFGIPSDNGRVGIVPVRIFSPQGSEAYTWLLVKQDGTWRITGVVPQRNRTGA